MNEELTTLVLMPGFDGTGKLFQAFVDELPAQVRAQVIAYPPDKLLSISDYAEFVTRQLPQGHVVLLAESFSGLIALSMLAANHKQVVAVIFCSAFAEPPRPFLLRIAVRAPNIGSLVKHLPIFLLRAFCTGFKASATQVLSLRTALAAVSPQVLEDRLALIATHRTTATGFKLPCFYLQAQHDRLVRAHSAFWFEDHFEHFTLEKIAGPHLLLQISPQECATRVVRILRQTMRITNP